MRFGHLNYWDLKQYYYLTKGGGGLRAPQDHPLPTPLTKTMVTNKWRLQVEFNTNLEMRSQNMAFLPYLFLIFQSLFFVKDHPQ